MFIAQELQMSLFLQKKVLLSPIRRERIQQLIDRGNCIGRSVTILI